ncbi:MAG: hypothetical protein IJJ71_12225 [Treponema sp.]|uniref:hypothetical protein n=1 Tax=Treponema sp. TaxID=166 RepID=UPI0025FB187A|nr:hypothetical protein [Treponema sp.]MBQ7538613.1 hypothetical protein [Treponema sp.]MBR0496930.1 hypothetical protein [Treponema sp.]
MDEVLKFANTLNYSYKFNSCKMLLSNWNGSKIYLVDSEAEKNLYLGWPTMIRETNGKFEEVQNNKEKLKIMNAADAA